MASATVLPNQSLTDIAVQHLGTAEAVFALAALNGLSVTDVLAAGQVLQLTPVEDERVVRFFALRELKPAANLDISPEELAGVGYWGIGQNFIVQ